MTWLIAGFGLCVSFLWFAQLIALIRHRSPRLWLANQSDSPTEQGWPGLTVIFAARDEADQIERATRSLLAQDYPDLTINAVNDRSTDATGQILDRLSGEDPRLFVINIQELPHGWLGKTHAMHLAACTATTTWLLFTDADVVFEPGALRRAISFAVQEKADHVTVVPEFVTKSVGERIFLLMFSLAFASRVLGGRVNSDHSRNHLGIGAFNLVRSNALGSIGGFENISMSVDDDNRLAQALKTAGFRCRALMGAGAVSVRWHEGLGGLIRGLEKNYFAILDFRLGVLTLACLAWIVIGFAPFAALFVGPWWTRAICAFGIAALATILALIRRQSGINWYYALVFPLGVVLNLIAMVRSAWLTIRRNGVRWRDRLYPLPELRAHVRQRNVWLSEMKGRCQQKVIIRDLSHDDISRQTS